MNSLKLNTTYCLAIAVAFLSLQSLDSQAQNTNTERSHLAITSYIETTRLRDSLQKMVRSMMIYAIRKTDANKLAAQADQNKVSRLGKFLNDKNCRIDPAIKSRISDVISESGNKIKEIEPMRSDVAQFILRKFAADSTVVITELSTSLMNQRALLVRQSASCRGLCSPEELVYLTASDAKESTERCQSDLSKYSMNSSKERAMVLQDSLSKAKAARIELNSLTDMSPQQSKAISELGGLLDRQIQFIESTKTAIDKPSKSARIMQVDSTNFDAIDGILFRLEQSLK